MTWRTDVPDGRKWALIWVDGKYLYAQWMPIASRWVPDAGWGEFDAGTPWIPLPLPPREDRHLVSIKTHCLEDWRASDD